MRSFVVLAALISAALCACPDGWKDRGNYCFHLSSGKESFQDARDRCIEMGGQMAKIDDFIKKTMYDTFSRIMDSFVIGLSFSPFRGWRWQDGSPMVYQNWMRGQNMGDTTDRCVEVTPTGEWKTVSCREKMRFICEQVKPMYSTVMSVQPKDVDDYHKADKADKTTEPTAAIKKDTAATDSKVESVDKQYLHPEVRPQQYYRPQYQQQNYRPPMYLAAPPVPFPFAFPSFPFSFPFAFPFPSFSWDPFGISRYINDMTNSMINTIGSQADDMVRRGYGNVVESTSYGPGFSGIASGSYLSTDPEGRVQRKHYTWRYP